MLGDARALFEKAAPTVAERAANLSLAEEKAKDSGVFLTVMGFGRGNLNDAAREKHFERMLALYRRNLG